MRPFARSLLSRIVVSFFALSALIVLLQAAVGYTAIVRDARRTAVSQLDTLAAAKVGAIESWLVESGRRLEFAATIDTIATIAARAPNGLLGSADRAALREALETVRRRWPELGEILYAAERGGLVLAATTPGLEGGYRLHDTWFVRGRDGTFVQNVYPSPITLQPTLSVSSPVRTLSGQLLGVLCANLDLRVSDRIVRELSGPYPTAESYLVDRFSVLVSAERYGTDSFPRGVHSPGIDAAVSGASGSGSYRNHRGAPVIGVYRWLDEQELALLVEVPTVDAFRAARREAAAMAGAGLLLVALLATGVYLLARRIAAPILAIEAAARRVAGGDLEARAPVETEDEIGALARSFNEMTSSLAELYATVRRNEERFRTLIEASSDVVAVASREGRLTFVSPSVERLYGYPPASLVGMELESLVHPEDAERVRRELTVVLPEAPQGHSVGIEYRMRDAEGHWHTVDTVARNMIGQPAVGGVLINSRDITERRLLETELAQAQKMEAVGRLAGGVAHDFNNLLTAIIGYAELVADRPDLPSGAADEVAEIALAAKRAAGLTQQLLAYSRKQVLQPRVLRLNDLVRETQALLLRLIGEHIAIHTALDPELLPILADPSQLQRVIINLALNARDAMPNGGTISIATRNAFLDGQDLLATPELSPGTYTVMEISDTGIGMDDVTIARLFEPFFTTKEMGKGTGLGLATVYGIVRQSGGRVTVRSRPGAGSTFRIDFPATGTSGTPARASAPEARAGGSESILLVEDEGAVARLMGDALSRAGYRVVTIGDSTEALALAERAREFDLLVTDVVMPTVDGRRLADGLRVHHPALSVLFVSGYAADDALRRGVSTDRLAFLQKPFTPEDLTRRVREILDRRGTLKTEEG